MNPFQWSFRAQFLAGFLGCAAILAYAIHTQLNLGLEPCPLCIFQRIAYAALGLVFLVGGLHGPRGAGGRRGRRGGGRRGALCAVFGVRRRRSQNGHTERNQAQYGETASDSVHSYLRERCPCRGKVVGG